MTFNLYLSPPPPSLFKLIDCRGGAVNGKKTRDGTHVSPWHCDGQLPHNRVYSFHVIISFDSNYNFGHIQLLLCGVYKSCRPPSSTLLQSPFEVQFSFSSFFLSLGRIVGNKQQKAKNPGNTHTHTHTQTSNWMLMLYI